MIRDDDLKVLGELGRIVDRYGPEPITRLAALIRDPQFADDLAAALEKTAGSSRRQRPRKTTRDADRIGMGVLNDLRGIDSGKHAAVAEFRERLMSGAVLSTMPEIRRFARTHNLEIGNASSRKAAIVPLLRSISEWETEAIADLLDSMTNYRTENRSLERWRDLIVKPNSSGP